MQILALKPFLFSNTAYKAVSFYTNDVAVFYKVSKCFYVMIDINYR